MKKIFVASDHAGVRVKKEALLFLKKNNYAFEDLSLVNQENDDYPDFASNVASNVIKNNALGILVCGTGIGMSIVANKHKGIRAALCKSSLDAKLSRSHNDANILVLSGKTFKKDINNIIKIFLTTKFEKGRHLRRLNKIKLLEK